MDKIRQALKGWKTYLVAGGSIIGVVVGWIEGAISPEEAVKLIVAAILACTIRASNGKAKA